MSRRAINEAIGYLRHFKADAEAGRACIPETIQAAIDRLQAAIAEPAPSPMFQPVAAICAADRARVLELRGEVPALQSALVGERGMR